MFDVDCLFHLPPQTPLTHSGAALEALRPIAKWLGSVDPSLASWFLGGDSLEASLQYEAFADGSNGHDAVRAVLAEEYRKSKAPVIYLWNGEDNEKGASLTLSVSETLYPSKVTLALRGSAANPRQPWADYRLVADLVYRLATQFNALCCTVYRGSSYFKHQTFMDRPGVGWMIYLPTQFAVQQVPEARALIPVQCEGHLQGTILVSVTEGAFNVRNPEHIQVARDIETRLVSHDWLPTWAQLTRPSS